MPRARPRSVRGGAAAASASSLVRFGLLCLFWTVLLQQAFDASELSRLAIAATGTSLVWLSCGYISTVPGGEAFRAGGFYFRLSKECTSLVPSIAFVAAVCASRARWASKLRWCLVSIVLLWIVNIVRVIILTTAMTRWPTQGVFAHYLLQYAMLILVGVLFTLWLARRQSNPVP